MTPPRLKLTSKKLDSGRFQVNFSTEINSGQFHGYLLTEPQTPVREIVEKISRHLDAMRNADRYFQRNLFSLTNREPNSGRILIFRTDKRKAA